MADSVSPAGPPSSPPTGAQPVFFDRAGATRIRDAVLYQERMVRGGTPVVRRGTPGAVKPSTYAVSTSTIGAASGLTLGRGTIQLCDRDGAECTAFGDDLDCYNAGGEVASGTLISVTWTDGDWSTCVAPCEDSVYGGA